MAETHNPEETWSSNRGTADNDKGNSVAGSLSSCPGQLLIEFHFSTDSDAFCTFHFQGIRRGFADISNETSHQKLTLLLDSSGPGCSHHLNVSIEFQVITPHGVKFLPHIAL